MSSSSILLVEDDTETWAMIARFLCGQGHAVTEAKDVATATSAWEAARPDVVLLDLGLPDGDGSDVIRRVRRDATTPIVVISARDQEAQKIDALDHGADDYVTKPFGMGELRARVDAVLRRVGDRPATSTAGSGWVRSCSTSVGAPCPSTTARST
jgi:two-component system KDP operon response regulator KdpE